MKIINFLLVLFSIFNLISLKGFAKQENQSDCSVCQKVVYQLKFDKIADCGKKACKNTCHKILKAWNAPNNIFADFENDVLGKCDICFRAGYCSLVECDTNKANELRLVNFIVENGLFRGKVDKETGNGFVVSHTKSHLTTSSIKQLESNVKISLKNSIRSDNAELASKQVGNIVDTYVNQGKDQNEKVIRRNVIYRNFILQSNTISEANDKEIEQLKALLEDYAKMKNFKTVSPVENKSANKSDRDSMKIEVKNLLKNMKISILDNLKLIEGTIKNVTDSHKKAISFKQIILKRNKQTLRSQEKNHLDALETEITSLENFKKTLEEIKINFKNKLETLKSFAFKLK